MHFNQILSTNLLFSYFYFSGFLQWVFNLINDFPKQDYIYLYYIIFIISVITEYVVCTVCCFHV